MTPSERIEKIRQGTSLYNSGQSKEASTVLLEIEFSADERDTSLYATYCTNLGAALAESGQFQLAIQYFAEAEKYFEMHHEWAAVGLTSFNLGNVHKYTGATRIAQSYYSKALECFRQVGEISMQVTVHLSLANFLTDTGKLEIAKQHLDEIYKLQPDENQRTSELNWSYYSLKAKLSYADDDPDGAINYFRKALTFAQQSNNKSYISEAMRMLGEILFAIKKYEEAYSWLSKAENLMNELGDYRTGSLVKLKMVCLEKIGHKATDVGGVARPNQLKSSAEGIRSPSQQPYIPVEVIVAKDVIQDKSGFLSAIHSRLSTRDGLLCVFHDQDCYLAVISTLQGVIELNTEDINPGAVLNSYWVNDETLNALSKIAPQIVQAGVEHRQNNNYLQSLYAYQFGLCVALSQTDTKGIEIVTGNLFTLDRTIRNQMKGSATVIGGKRKDEAQKESLEKALHQTEQVAREFVLLVEELLVKTAKVCDNPTRLNLLVSLRRLMMLGIQNHTLEQIVLPAWAGGGVIGPRPSETDIKRRALLTEIAQLTEMINQPVLMIESIYEELSQIFISELLEKEGITTKPTNHIAKQLEIDLETILDNDTGFGWLWQLYSNCRQQISSLSEKTLVASCSLAVAHFEKLRALAVYAGTGSGHVTSYAVTQYLGKLNRDFIELLIQNNLYEFALEVAEQTCSRAMVDWMGRTHANNRLVFRDGFVGSIGEVATASTAEILKVASESNSLLLYYVALLDDFIVWLVHPDGYIVCERIEKPSPLVAALFKFLPYSTNPAFISRASHNFESFFMDFSDSIQIDKLLVKLGEQLVPASIRKVLQKSKGSSLTIITDRELSYIPFACLRFDEKYLIEYYNIQYWPSVTSWILCERVVQQWKAGLRVSLPAIVIGDPAFANPYIISSKQGMKSYAFEQLPDSANEAQMVAEMLGVKPLIGNEATFATIIERYNSDANAMGSIGFVPVMHLATHGIINMDDPESSFVALADGPLTAGFLYSFDPGLRGHLVMLSCCQTGLGFLHPDSLIGLVNAFLISGACSVGSTLWQVPDQATQKLMEYFYAELQHGSNLSSAIRKAQLLLLNHSEWRHPLFWGAFKITGSNVNPLRAAS